MRLINADQLEQTLTEAINMMTAMAAVIGVEEDEGVQMELKAYKDILDGVKGQETVKAIPDDWIDSYIDWLNSVGTEFTSRDARAINAMMIKWETNPDLPQAECSDACDL